MNGTILVVIHPVYAKRSSALYAAIKNIDQGTSHRGRINRLVYGLPKLMRKFRITQYMVTLERDIPAPEHDSFVLVVDVPDAEVVKRFLEVV